MSGEEREEVVWTAFEKRHLFREFKSGKKVVDLARVHKRKKVTIRKTLIDLGAVDPVDDEIKATLHGVPHAVIEKLRFGQKDPRPSKFRRDCLAWTAGEIALLAESYAEQLSMTALVLVHQRHPVSILAPIYENKNSELFEKEPESMEEALLRAQRLEGYQEAAYEYCNLGSRSVDEVIRQSIVAYQIEESFWNAVEIEEDEIHSDESGHQARECSWPDDADPEWWEQHMGGPDDDDVERAFYSPPDDDFSDDELYAAPSSDFETAKRNEKKQSPSKKYEDLEFFEFKSAFETTTVGALARRCSDDFWEVESIFFIDQWALKSAIAGERFLSLRDLQNFLNKMHVTYVEK
jgi:hypothetical protein